MAFAHCDLAPYRDFQNNRHFDRHFHGHFSSARILRSATDRTKRRQIAATIQNRRTPVVETTASLGQFGLALAQVHQADQAWRCTASLGTVAPESRSPLLYLLRSHSMVTTYICVHTHIHPNQLTTLRRQTSFHPGIVWAHVSTIVQQNLAQVLVSLCAKRAGSRGMICWI